MECVTQQVFHRKAGVTSRFLRRVEARENRAGPFYFLQVFHEEIRAVRAAGEQHAKQQLLVPVTVTHAGILIPLAHASVFCLIVHANSLSGARSAI